MNFAQLENEIVFGTKDSRWKNLPPPGPSYAFEYCNAFVPDTYDEVFVLSHRGLSLTFTFCIRRHLDSLDIFSPYGYGGLSCPDIMKGISFLERWGKLNKFTTAYFTFTPTPPTPPSINRQLNKRTIFFLETGRGYKQIRSSYSKNILDKLEMPTEELSFIDDIRLHKTDFAAMYRETMDRVGARGIYYFSDSTIDKLISAASTLGVGLMSNGKLQAASLFVTGGTTAEYFINCSKDSGRSYSAHLLDRAVINLCKMNFQYLNLGGGAKEGDGLEAFKRRFGGIKYDLFSYPLIFDSEKYERLCSAAPMNSAFFPRYYS